MVFSRLRCRRLLGCLAAVLLAAPAAAQPPQRVAISSAYTLDDSRQIGRLLVTTTVDYGFHIFGTEKTGNNLPTRFNVAPDQGLSLTGSFEPDADPHLEFDFETNEEIAQFEGSITWSAPFRVAEGADPLALSIQTTVSGQVCDENGCLQFGGETVAAYRPPASGDFRPAAGPLRFSGSVAPQPVEPGRSIEITLRAIADDGWRIAPTDAAPGRAATPLIVITKSNGWSIEGPVPTSNGDNRAWQWVIRARLPAETPAKTHTLTGLLALHATGTDGALSPPLTVAFTADVEVDPAGGSQSRAVVLKSGPEFAQVQRLHELLQAEEATPPQTAGAFAGYSFATVMILAFFAGLILNVMPCVLPVIGLKVMSFVQQAGEHPRRVFLLNATFALGMVSVFLLLATLAVFARYGWGDLFTNVVFQMTMIAVVVVFGLSFLGVWEIPIPGFSSQGGELAEREGYVGALFKGVLTTFLATPCSGPLLIPTVVWAMAQPPAVTYATFLAMGVGMAFPYLAIGLFPKLVAVLPRPGDWMVTFKELMGFVMLGAAIFLVGGLREKFVISALAFSLGLAVACWRIGRTSVAAEFGDKARAWLIGGAIAVASYFVAFNLLIPQHELEWNRLSVARIEDELAAGNIVFVDFTADW